MNQRSADEIERDLDRTRAEMTRTIDAIQDRLSPGQLFEQGLRYIQNSGGRSLTDGAAVFAQNFGRAVRDNPIPFALVATGLVWMMTARKRPYRADVYEDYPDYDEIGDYEDYPALEEEEVGGDWGAHYGSAAEGRTPYERGAETTAPAAAATATPEPATPSGEAQRERAGLGGSIGAASVSEQRAQEAARQAEMAGHAQRSEQEQEATQRAIEGAEEARRQAERATRAANEARRQAERAGGGDGSRGGARARAEAARQWAGERGQGARQRMHRMREDARRGAGQAGQSARRYAQGTASVARQQASRARSGLSHLLEERPLLVGAIGLAIGAALGAALPRTRREDEWMGETRDSLKRRAHEEYEKAERVAERAYGTARDEVERQGLTPEGARRAARETAQEAAQEAERIAGEKARDVESRMRKVGDAVTGAAKDEAKRQDLGGGTGGSTSPGRS